MRYKTLQLVKPTEEKHNITTRLSAILTFLAVGVMLYIGIRHFNDVDELGQAWGRYAFVHVIFGAVGFLFIQFSAQDSIIPRKYRPMEVNTILFSGIVLLIAMGSQFIAQATYSVSTTEQALYYVFSAVTEEVFFRGFMCYAVIRTFGNKMKPKTLILMKMVVIVVSGVIFAVLHTNYQWTAMFWGVLIGGILFGTAFVFFLKYDLTAMILGHFILNLIVTGTWLVNL